MNRFVKICKTNVVCFTQLYLMQQLTSTGTNNMRTKDISLFITDKFAHTNKCTICKTSINSVIISTINFYFVTIAVIAYFVMRFTKFGRRLYSIGGNPETAYLSGINLDWNKITAYAISGFLASFTSLIVISRIGQSQPAMGVAYPLETIAASVIGGVALSGGRGSIPGVFLGVILLGLIRNSLNILRVQSFYQYVMLGVVIVIAVTLSNIGSNKKI